MLSDEYEQFDREWKTAAADILARTDEAERVAGIIQLKHRRGPQIAALCFSGGGIRSATFNLGVLQGLARIGLLDKFQYLSTVSGGGYIGAWLSSWIHRDREEVFKKLRNETLAPGQPESAEITFLREYSNYLAPRLGVLSADSWTMIAIVLRNLLLNWLVILPILAVLLALPALVLNGGTNLHLGTWWSAHFWPDAACGAVLLAIAFFFQNLLRVSLREPKRRGHALGLPTPELFLALGLGPLLLAMPLLALDLVVPGDSKAYADWYWRMAPWGLVAPFAGFVIAALGTKWIYATELKNKKRGALRYGRRETILTALAVAVAGSLQTALYAWIGFYWSPTLVTNLDLLMTLTPLLTIGPLLIGQALFVGVASVSEQYGRSSEKGDAEREWWARWSAWQLLVVLGWAGLCLVGLYGPKLLGWCASTVSAKLAVLATGPALGGIVSWLGKSAATAATANTESKAKTGNPWPQRLLPVLLPLFCIVGASTIAFGTGELVRALSMHFGYAPTDPRTFGVLAATLAALLLLSSVSGFFVNVNRFSLQALYRNRLVRAYLGASHEHRRPNPFTGFDLKDNVRMHHLEKNRLLHVVNATCNLVAGSRLAWQQRKAASFTITPLHCGGAEIGGYRSSHAYGGKHGISLGTAVATSGAAANPNMGYNSSPLLSVIMTIFNARLGTWLGNPGRAGSVGWLPVSEPYTLSGPRHGTKLLLAEALGLTDDQHPYVNLSDGGHFENLGLYEMVRRRANFILVIDAGCDPDGKFDDLGNAIRKIRIDFGIPITYEVFAVQTHDTPGHYCAVGRVDYAKADSRDSSEPVKAGTLLYVKPALCGTEPRDVVNYQKAAPTFPHETTADQFFSESQFESYRALGQFIIERMSGALNGAREFRSSDEFATAVGLYLQGACDIEGDRPPATALHLPPLRSNGTHAEASV